MEKLEKFKGPKPILADSLTKILPSWYSEAPPPVQLLNQMNHFWMVREQVYNMRQGPSRKRSDREMEEK